MNSKCFFSAAEQSWTEVRSHCKDAVVYMDDAAAECLHWFYGGNGIEKFFEFGAIAIENFSPFVVRLLFVPIFPVNSHIYIQTYISFLKN